MEQQFSSLDRVMKPETISKNGASLKSHMSRKKLINVLAGILILAVFSACDGGGGSSAKIKMTTEKAKLWFLLSGSGTATVDWGDGSEKVTLTIQESSNPISGIRFEHDYNSATIRTISINGDNITGLLCQNYQLTSLDVSKNTALTGLNVAQNQLTSLDVSKNPKLTILECFNNQLTNLDVSKNTLLKILYCNYNQLISLDVSKNTELTELLVDGNKLTSLDVSKNSALTRLNYDNDRVKLIK